MANYERPIEGLMDVTLEKINQMVDANTVIGTPIIAADGSTILPVSKVTFGFASGGSDIASQKVTKDLFGGGSGAGVTIVPIAFLVIQKENVRLIQLAGTADLADRALDMLPGVVDKISGLVSNASKKKNEQKQAKVQAEPDIAEAAEDISQFAPETVSPPTEETPQ